jgi:hypothetical protein
MARFVEMDSRNQGDEDETYLSPEIEIIPEERERFEKMGAAFGQQLIDEYRASGKDPYEYSLVATNPYHPYFSPGWTPNLMEGWRWPTLDQPFRDKLVGSASALVDIVGTSFGTYAISDRVIDIIESIEPKTHQYLQYELIQPDGSVHPQKRRLLNICTRTEALDYERSNVIALRDMPSFFHDRTRDTLLIFRKSVVENRAFWYEYRYRGTKGQFLVSDRLWEALTSAGCSGWKPQSLYGCYHFEEL